MALYINGNKTGGGGGGNTDVVHLTQAEYDALPSSKLSDDKIYMITDANGNGENFQPIIYSENEREIGVWTDGKPLYQKTVYYVGGTTGTISIAHNITNLGHCVSAIGSAYDIGYLDGSQRTDVGDVPFPRIASDGYNIGIVKVNTTNIMVVVPSIFNDRITDIYITLQYTKITDTAGSGTWTPQGIPAVHYSTDEQVIGTWVDGSTVYEKTFVTTLPNSPDIGSDSMLIGTLTNFNDIIKIEGTIKDVTANAWCATSGLPWYGGANGWQYSFHINPSGQLCVWFASDSTQYYNAYKGGKAIATVQYTKIS